MADLTAYRAALATDLALVFPDTDIHEGPRTGKATQRAKATLFWQDEAELAGAVVVGQARMVVRYWPVSAKVRDDAPAGVRDPSQLETAKTQLQSFLQGKQTAYSSTGVWFSRLTNVVADYDPEEWGVEGQLLLMFSNPSVL